MWYNSHKKTKRVQFFYAKKLDGNEFILKNSQEFYILKDVEDPEIKQGDHPKYVLG